MVMGLRILHPRLMEGYDLTNFSFLEVMDKAQSMGKLGGYDHKGDWYHISTPEDLDAANKTLFKQAI